MVHICFSSSLKVMPFTVILHVRLFASRICILTLTSSDGHRTRHPADPPLSILQILTGNGQTDRTFCYVPLFPIIPPKVFSRMTNPPNVYSLEYRIPEIYFLTNPRKYIYSTEKFYCLRTLYRYYKFDITIVCPIAFK